MATPPYYPLQLIAGRTSGNVNVPVLVDSTGKLVIGAVSGGGSGPIEDGVTSTILATVFDYANSNPLATVLVDATGTATAPGDATAANQVTQTTHLAALAAQSLDYDTGGGTDAQVIFGIALPAAGGAVAGGTATNPIRTDPTGTTAQPVTDNGGSLTVDANNLDVRDLVAASDAVTVHGDVGAIDQLDLTNSNPVTVAIVDTNGDQISSFGGGTQYTEDAAAAANPVGTALNLVRDDARAGGLTTTDGDNVAARGTNAGELYVKHVDSVAVTNAGLTELAAAINGSSQLDVNIAAQSLGTLTVASHAVTNAGTFAVQESGAALTALQLIDDVVKADDAAFSVGTDKVAMVGANAVAHGSNPDAADANDAVALIANRHRVLFTIGGHPNIITTEYLWTTAQTDDAVVTVSTGSKIVVTQLQVTIDEATTVGVGFRVGFATATLPTAPTDGTAVAGYLASHRGMVPGSGLSRGDGSGILGIGADDEDLRITCEAPTNGSASLVVSYYTIPS